jgi:hypothetical protein
MSYFSLFCQLWSSVIYGQHERKVYIEYMYSFHLVVRRDSKRGTYYVCLECHYRGVDIPYVVS